MWCLGATAILGGTEARTRIHRAMPIANEAENTAGGAIPCMANGRVFGFGMRSVMARVERGTMSHG